MNIESENERVCFAVTSAMHKNGKMVVAASATAWHKGFSAFVSKGEWQVTKLGTGGEIYAQGKERDNLLAAEKAAEVMEGKKIGVKLV
jgi:hypothetical protein